MRNLVPIAALVMLLAVVILYVGVCLQSLPVVRFATGLSVVAAALMAYGYYPEWKARAFGDLPKNGGEERT